MLAPLQRSQSHSQALAPYLAGNWSNKLSLVRALIILTLSVVLGAGGFAVDLGQRLTALNNVELVRPAASPQASFLIVAGFNTWRHEQRPFIGLLAQYQQADTAVTLLSPESRQELTTAMPQLPPVLGVGRVEQEHYFHWAEQVRSDLPILLCDRQQHVLWMGTIDELEPAITAARAGRLDRHFAADLAQRLSKLQRATAQGNHLE